MYSDYGPLVGQIKRFEDEEGLIGVFLSLDIF